MPEKAAKDQKQPHKPPVKQRSHHYSVYVIELAPKVWNIARFRRCNPDYMLGKPLVYLGMTGLDIDQRFDKHKAGIQSSRYARDFGLRLLPEPKSTISPTSAKWAVTALPSGIYDRVRSQSKKADLMPFSSIKSTFRPINSSASSY